MIGWEAEATERGAALATVATDAAAAPVAVRSRARKKPARTADEATSARGTTLGKIFLTEIDPQAKAGAPVLVSGEPTAQLDVTLAEVAGKYVIAWTDERNIDDVRLPGRGRPGRPGRRPRPTGRPRPSASRRWSRWSPSPTGRTRRAASAGS